MSCIYVRFYKTKFVPVLQGNASGQQKQRNGFMNKPADRGLTGQTVANDGRYVYTLKCLFVPVSFCHKRDA